MADANPNNITSDKAEFIERKAEETFKYVLESYDVARAEGKNVLQWLFGAAIGGVGFTGSLVQKGYYSIAIGTFVGALWAAYSAYRLIKGLDSQPITPPGNEASAFSDLLEKQTLPTIRFLEAKGLSEGTSQNRTMVSKLSSSVDDARRSISYIPLVFLITTAVVIVIRIIQHTCSDNQYIGFLNSILHKVPL